MASLVLAVAALVGGGSGGSGGSGAGGGGGRACCAGSGAAAELTVAEVSEDELPSILRGRRLRRARPPPRCQTRS